MQCQLRCISIPPGFCRFPRRYVGTAAAVPRGFGALFYSLFLSCSRVLGCRSRRRRVLLLLLRLLDPPPVLPGVSAVAVAAIKLCDTRNDVLHSGVASSNRNDRIGWTTKTFRRLKTSSSAVADSRRAARCVLCVVCPPALARRRSASVSTHLSHAFVLLSYSAQQYQIRRHSYQTSRDLNRSLLL